MGSSPASRRIDRRTMNFGVTSVAAPNAASSSTAKYSWMARPGDLRRKSFLALDTLLPVCLRLDQAGIDPAKPSPPTRPSLMQRRKIVSNSRRSRSLWREAACACRFFENVEWSGTPPSSWRRQNQRYARLRWTSSPQPPGRSGCRSNSLRSASGSSARDRSMADPRLL